MAEAGGEMLGERLPSFPDQGVRMLLMRPPCFLLRILSPLLWSPLQDPMVYMNDKSPLVSDREKPVKSHRLQKPYPHRTPRPDPWVCLSLPLRLTPSFSPPDSPWDSYCQCYLGPLERPLGVRSSQVPSLVAIISTLEREWAMRK